MNKKAKLIIIVLLGILALAAVGAFAANKIIGKKIAAQEADVRTARFAELERQLTDGVVEILDDSIQDGTISESDYMFFASTLISRIMEYLPDSFYEHPEDLDMDKIYEIIDAVIDEFFPNVSDEERERIRNLAKELVAETLLNILRDLGMTDVPWWYKKLHGDDTTAQESVIQNLDDLSSFYKIGNELSPTPQPRPSPVPTLQGLDTDPTKDLLDKLTPTPTAPIPTPVPTRPQVLGQVNPSSVPKVTPTPTPKPTTTVKPTPTPTLAPPPTPTTQPLLLPTLLPTPTPTPVPTPAHKHNNGSEVIEKQATCTKEGEAVTKCKDCNEVTERRTIPALGHSWGGWEEVREATCARKGKQERTCSRCGVTETKTTAKLKHTPGEPQVTLEPTCTKPGRSTTYCTECGAVVKTASIPATKHVWSPWEVVNAATCKESGLKSRKCSVCGEVETEEIHKLSHVPSEEYVIKDSNCTETGIIGIKCTLCGEILSQKEVPPSSHIFGEWVVVQEATCQHEGIKRRTCTKCGYVEEIKSKKIDHVAAKTKTVDVKPTCTSSGLESYHCIYCKQIIDSTRTVLEPLEHSWNKTIVPSTCTTTGNEHYVCTKCGATRDVVIDKTQHRFSTVYTVDQQPTCLDVGSKSYHCLDCGAIDPTSVVHIPVLDHTPSDYTVDKAATCATTGAKSRHCTVCMTKLDTVSIPAVGHSYGAEQNTNEDNVADGYVHKICTVCPPTEPGHDLKVRTIPYTITLSNLSGASVVGMESPNIEYDAESGNITIPPASKPGYTFNGWSVDGADPVQTVVIPTGSYGNHTITASWTENTYTVSYNLNGGEGTIPEPTTYKYTDTITLPTFPNIYKTGCTFYGWAKSEVAAAIAGNLSNSQSVRDSNTFIDKETTQCSKLTATAGDVINLYAIWVLNPYDITYDLAGGEITDGENPTIYNAETDSFTLLNPKRLGYDFAGWTGTGLTSAQEVVTVDYGSTGNRSYTATWTARAYHIHYTKGAGDRGDPFLSTTTYSYNDTATLDAPGNQGFEKDGYAHTGWSVSAVKISDYATTYAMDDLIVDSGITVSATYTPVIYNINYTNVYGCEFTEENPTTYTILTESFRLNNPTKNGNTFAGWTGSNLTEPTLVVNIPKGTYGDLTFNATFTAQTYNITYDTAGGEFVSTYNNTYTFGIGRMLPGSSSIKRDGYTFVGWYPADNPDGSPVLSIGTNETGDKSFVAKWTPINYDITYELDSGTVTGNPTYYDIETPDFSLNNPTKDGYNFTGWTGTGLTGMSTHVVVTEGSTGDRTYTAHYTPKGYDVTYHLNGGTVISGTSSGDTYIDQHTYGTAKPLLTNTGIERTGYQFKGWYLHSDFTGDAQTEVSATLAEPAEYWAKWEPIQYNIHYIMDAAVSDPGNPTSYTIESPTITLLPLTRDNYDFTGWTWEGQSTPQMSVTIPHGSLGSRTFTANWNVVTYSITYNLGGGTASGNPTNYSVISDTFTLNNPTRNGYTFTGWSGTDITGTSTTVTVTTGHTGDREYTANWALVDYPITYNLGGGTNDTGNPSTYTIESSFVLGDATKDGHTFTGWTENGVTTTPQFNYSVAPGQTGAKTFTANWDVVTYDITYDLAGGHVTGNPSTYTITTNAITLVKPTRSGYTFAGWTGTGLTSATENVTIPKGSMGDRSYTATWALIDYPITYIMNSGTNAASNPSTYNIETSFTLADPTRVGYTFAGWTEQGVTSEPVKDYAVDAGQYGNKTFTANWTIVNYDITYALSGGTATGNPYVYNYNSGAITLNNPTRNGYAFKGWTGTDLTTATIEVTIPANSIGDRSYTATWSAIDYSINYTMNGGTNSSENPAKYNIETTVKLKDPTREGYTFTGWTENGVTTTPAKGYTIALGQFGTKTFTAHWTEVPYSITYTLAGGTVTGNPDTYNIASEPITLNKPTRTGYTFLGWTGTGLTAATKEVTIPTGSIGNRSYTATWEPITYNITYNLDGGTNAVDNPHTYNIESSYTLHNATRTGYNFIGWTEDGVTTTPTLNYVIEFDQCGNKSFTAHWAVIPYNITYNLAGGSVTGNPSTYNVASAAITLNNPTRNGYTFKGWTGTGLTAATKSVTIPSGSTGDRSYVATWEVITYSINYTMNGGTNSSENPVKYNTETKVNLKAPTRAGYSFTGWTEDGVTTTPAVNYTIELGQYGNKTFTAHWNEVPYTITYDLAGGTVTGNPSTYNIASAAITLKNPTRNGYTFKGWTGTDLASASKSVTIPSGSMGNRSYVATWELINYNITYNLDGGTNDTNNPLTYNTEHSYTLRDATKEGYNFIGWTEDGVTTTPTRNYVIELGQYGNKTFTAHFTAKSIYITYAAGSGVGSMPSATLTYDPDGVTLANNAFTKTGYHFDHWNTSVGDTGSSFAKAADMRSYINLHDGENVIVYAIWDANKLLVTLKPNGGFGEEVTKELVYDTDTTLPLNTFTRTGYTFVGWNTETDGSGTAYEDGADLADDVAALDYD